MARRRTDIATAERQYVQALKERRAELAAALDETDKTLKALGVTGRVASTVKRARRRTRGTTSLRAVIEAVLAKGKSAMSLKELEQAIRAAGYKSTAKSLYIQMLVAIRKSDLVKRVERGVYAFKGAGEVTKPATGKRAARKTKAKKKRKAKARKAKK